jgi:hypothetical protein
MTIEVVISEEAARGCGHRKPAKDGVGVYLVGPSEMAPCGRLPYELHACPTCGGGIKPARGWSWIEPRVLFVDASRPTIEPVNLFLDGGVCSVTSIRLGRYRAACQTCPLGLGMPEGRHGLIWIGEAHYASPAEFMAEARRMGVSRKIKAVPKDFELGKTIVYLAHRHTPLKEMDLETGEPKRGPAIFTAFKPMGIDLVIADENKVPEKAEKLAEKYGARIVKVIPKLPEQPPEAEPVQRSLPMVP